MITRETVQRVREAVPVLDLVREHGVVLKQRGNDWWAQCPFHNEKSASFKVSEKRNAFKCFGCGAGGDVIQFYMRTRGMDPHRDFPTALRELAKRAGVTIDEEGNANGEWKKVRRKRTRAEIEAENRRKEEVAAAVRAQNSLGDIVRGWPWPEAEMFESDGGRRVPEGGPAQARALLSLFDAEDVIWCGEYTDSIGVDDYPNGWKARRERCARCFRPAGEWMKSPRLPGSRVCASIFKPGRVFSRSLEMVLRPRFLVLEHDHAALDVQAALLRWVTEEGGLTLRAVVFTGGKSLHGWFDYPPQARVEALRPWLIGVKKDRDDGTGVPMVGGFGFDGAILNAVQPWRVPGWKHKSGNYCELRWIQ